MNHGYFLYLLLQCERGGRAGEGESGEGCGGGRGRQGRAGLHPGTLEVRQATARRSSATAW